MDFKIGMLAMVVGIAIVGMLVSSVSANYVYAHTENYGNTASCTVEVPFPPWYWGIAICNQGLEGSGDALAIDGSGHQEYASNPGMCCMPGYSFQAKAISGGYNYVYAAVGCMK